MPALLICLVAGAVMCTQPATAILGVVIMGASIIGAALQALR